MAALQPPVYVTSVDHLRHVLETQVEPGQRVIVAIDGNVSFQEARRIWEVVTTNERPCELVNVEVLNHKHLASLFIRNLVNDLKTWRGRVDSKIDRLVQMLSAMEEVIQAGGPAIPEGYEPVLLHGPRLYIDVDQAGRVNGDRNRKEVMGQFDYNGLNQPRPQCDYWQMDKAVIREDLDGHSFIRINQKLIKEKIKILRAHREQISKSIRSMESMDKDRMFIGYGNCSLHGFRDLDMLEACPRCNMQG